MHLTGRNSPSESQKCVQLSTAVGEMLWDLSDRLNHIIWRVSKRGSVVVMGSEVKPTQLNYLLVVRPWIVSLNSLYLSFFTCKLSIIISLL